jgi:HEAT repeat protein
MPIMVALLTSEQVELRRAAADILSDIATSAALTPLAKLALNDDDQDVRYYAVLGLASASGNDDAPTRADFGRQAAQFLGQWRDWARTHIR